MCTGDCAKFIGASLYPFCALCIICNLLLLFPGWTTEAVQDPQEKLTPEVLYLGGFFGSGLLVLIPAICIQYTGRHGKLNNRVGMLVSIVLAAVAVCGSIYGFVTSLLGLLHGPQCYYQFISGDRRWTSPFKREWEYLELERSYLFHREVWSRCTIPVGVVEFNVILFSTIMVASAVQVVLCTIQMINGLLGFLCGTCQRRRGTV
ncbi:transmembrane 4 L6 family member 5-like [Hyla sarda]|uniref:transmembrane 4 L6 family member 5-like n=1 Tax=Hyla sarda TaxID=327740 RepID=UPI0024C2BBBA|nr:transmembrane 4 L6 family member 5-like [Hyla sarda]